MGSIFAGYAQIWRSRMSLVGVVAVIFAPGLCAEFLIGLASAGSYAPIVNGGYLVFNTGFPVILKSAVLLFFWVWAVSAGVIVVIGQSRQIEPGLSRLLRWTMPYAGAVSSAFGLLFALAFAAFVVLGPAGPIAATVIMVALAASLATMLFSIPASPLRQNMFAVIEGRWWRTCGAAVLGVVILPGLALTIMQSIVSLIASPLVAGAVLTAGMVVVVAGQAGFLATAYLNASQGVDFDKVDVLLSANSGGPAATRAAGLPAVVALLPALVMAGMAAINPYDVPAVSQAAFEVGGQVTAAGWPEGQYPIIATADGFLDCRNETCSEHVRHAFAPVTGQLIPANSIQEITADGTILSLDASAAGRLVLQRCVRTGACSRGDISGSFGYPDVAITAAGDGTIYIAVVDKKADDSNKSSAKKTKVDVLRCDEATCGKPAAMSLGEVDGALYRNVSSTFVGSRRYAVKVTPIRVAVDARKRPSVAILAGFGGIGTKLLRCEDPACAAVTDIRTAEGGFVPATTVLDTLHPGARVSQGMIAEANEVLLRCGGFCELDLLTHWASRGNAAGALTFSSSGMYAITAEHPAQAQMQVTIGIGSALSQSRYTLWRCRQAQCQDMDTMLLNAGPQALGLWLSARSDGSVFVVEDSGELRTLALKAWRDR